MIVRACRECPFRQKPMLSGVMALFSGDTGRGFCGYDSASDSVIVVEMGIPDGSQRRDMMRRAAGRRVIEDVNTIPDACPLHNKDVVVTLGS